MDGAETVDEVEQVGIVEKSCKQRATEREGVQKIREKRGPGRAVEASNVTVAQFVKKNKTAPKVYPESIVFTNIIGVKIKLETCSKSARLAAELQRT